MKKHLLLSAAWLALGVSTPSHAVLVDDVPYPFYILDFSHQHLANDLTEFSVTFSAPPKLQTYDAAVRAQGTFQYYILPYAEDPLPSSNPYAYIFRAPEGPGQESTLKVRRGDTPSSSEPRSGGWGPVTEETPLFINGNTITFTLHDASFGYAPGRDLRYSIASYVYGSTASMVTNVPEPGACALLTVGALSIAAVARSRRTRQRS